ncbi:MAG: porin [Syntrophales bacterium]
MKRLCFFLTLFVFSFSLPLLPAIGADTSTEIEQLKGEVQKLLNRIEELEKKQVATEVKTVEIEKKELQAGYDKGFYVKTGDKSFLLKTNLFLQFRYTYLPFDRTVNANDEDWSNFLIRRARVIFSGNAPNKDWLYFFHIQLEPSSTVNLHDAYVTWKQYPFAQVQFGRAKLPYGLEFWQSASQLNGVERSIFSGETDVDGKSDTRKWPGGNANFPVSDEDSVTKYPIGGLNLFRSQGIQLQGDINLFGQEGFLQYWTGVYNGRNTKGNVNIDSNHLWVGRISINPLGKYNLVQQGDIDYSLTPKVCFLVSGMQYKDRLNKYRDTIDSNNDGYGDERQTAYYDIEGTGYNLAAILRYRGFSMDAEYGYDRLEQDRMGGYTWDRYGYRFNAGYFLIPKKFEITARYAYVKRLDENTAEMALASGLGIVSVNGGTNNAIEDNLQEHTIGLNYFFFSHNLKFFMDYSYLKRDFTPLPGSTVAVDSQSDNRYRAMMQFYF